MSEENSGRILVVISGSGSNLQAIIDACANGDVSGHICAVISNKPAVYGLERAEKANIQTAVLNHREFDSREDYDLALAELIDSFAADLIVLAGFMRILTPDFVRKFQGKLLNIHPSLLTKYPGLHTHKRALENGDTAHGATVHFVTEELDGGPPIIQGNIDIEASDDESSLAEKVQLQVEHKIYPLAVEWCLTGRIEFKDNGVKLDGELLPSNGFQFRP
ncbi:UNVERIFIED_CONTAM: hypothetical protein GTU68_045167 [Idotea baltica]|nr:hypothetical protein [Idotea baltica]